MFSTSSTLLSSSANSGSTSNTTTEILSAVQSQSFEEKIPLTSKEKVEKKLASILAQVQHNQIKCLDLTAASLGHFYVLTNRWDEHKDAIHRPMVLENGTFAKSFTDNTIRLCDLASNTYLFTLRGHSDLVHALIALPDGLLASGSADTTIKLWDLASHSCLATLQGHTDAVYALVVLPDGFLASGSADTTIKLWDLASHSCLATLQGHTDATCVLAVLPNARLASGSKDTTIKLWDLASNTCLSTLLGHTDTICTLAALPDGLLASGSCDNTIKLWDLTSQSCLATLKGHTDAVWALTVPPNDQLVSGSRDKTIKLWESKTISTKQLSPIFNALKNNTSVTSLDLSGNRDIRDDIIDPLINIFKKPGFFSFFAPNPNTTLKSFDLRRTGVSQKGVKKLEKAIKIQRLSIEVLADCPVEWMMIYFLIVFCRANRNSPFADSGLDLCKHELSPFLGLSSGFFSHHSKNPSSNTKHVAIFPT